MSRRCIAAAVVLVLGIVACAHTSHYEANAFSWNGAVPAGQWVHLRNLHGTINVTAATGPNVEVRASKHWTHGSGVMHFVENAAPDGITICAMPAGGSSCSSEHSAGSEHHGVSFSLFGRRSDTRVDFVVSVPPGINLDLGSVDGSVRAAGTSGTVEVKVVNGDIDVASHQGALDLITVNGSVTAALDSLPANGDISMKSVNGSITAVLPPKLDGTASFETVTGHISNGFQLTTDAPANSRHLTGTIGAGGSRHIDLKTVNGSVTLLKHA